VFAPQCLSTLAVVKRETNLALSAVTWRCICSRSRMRAFLTYRVVRLLPFSRRRGLGHRGMTQAATGVGGQCGHGLRALQRLALLSARLRLRCSTRWRLCPALAHGAAADGGAAAWCAVAARRRLRRLRAALYRQARSPGIKQLCTSSLTMRSWKLPRVSSITTRRQKFTASHYAGTPVISQRPAKRLRISATALRPIPSRAPRSAHEKTQPCGTPMRGGARAAMRNTRAKPPVGALEDHQRKGVRIANQCAIRSGSRCPTSPSLGNSPVPGFRSSR